MFMTATPSLSFPLLSKCKNPCCQRKQRTTDQCDLHLYFISSFGRDAQTLPILLGQNGSASPCVETSLQLSYLHSPSKHCSHKIHPLCMFSTLCLKSILSKSYNNCIIRS